MNHIFQISVEWRPQSLVDLVTKLYVVVQSMYKDLRKALFGRGMYQLAAVDYMKYSTEYHASVDKSEDERDSLYKKFRKYKPKKGGCVVSTDGKLTIPDIHFGGGKKPGQRKRNAKNNINPRQKTKRI
jgi:hypothetical protein